jgi:RNA 3'-terminal phosphate cyclase (ATP)
VSATSGGGNLPLSIAERQAHSALSALQSALGLAVPLQVLSRAVPAFGQGTFLFLKGEYQRATSGFTGLGARGKPAEVVGQEAAAEFLTHHASGMPVDPHLADQLVLYLAQAKYPSILATSRITGHLETNLAVTGYFLDQDFQITGARDAPGTVSIAPRGKTP